MLAIAATIAGGLALLVLGGEAVVRGAVGAARRLGVSELFIGLTLVGFGTSTPELLTSIQAALAGSPGIAVGNVVGSNIGNVLLILATVVLVRPIAVDLDAVRRDGGVMIAVSALLVAVALAFGGLSRIAGAGLLLLLAAYIGWALKTDKDPADGAAARPAEQAPLWRSLLVAAAGLALLIVGADLLVDGAIALARVLGMSETVIGLTIVAVGTSLPELVASLAAALRGRPEVAFGNVVGSNIYNILGILGATALVAPVPIPPDMAVRDWAAMLGAAVLLVVHAWTGARISRGEGAGMLALYALYCWLLVGSA